VAACSPCLAGAHPTEPAAQTSWVLQVQRYVSATCPREPDLPAKEASGDHVLYRYSSPGSDLHAYQVSLQTWPRTLEDLIAHVAL